MYIRTYVQGCTYVFTYVSSMLNGMVKSLCSYIRMYLCMCVWLSVVTTCAIHVIVQCAYSEQ